ncbi:MAG: hypothetical protein JWR08_1404 [Enterovirga sp.]|jgi:DNA-binding IclR family transcriptional regulator|nr:hypothetical protein [Enterovirga sp.]
MSVKSSWTVFRVLRHLSDETGPLNAADLAGRLSIPVTTAARALATLEAAGYAERHQGSSRFLIGKSARTLAFAFMAQFPVRDLAMPYLQQLTLETGLTSSLFVRLGWFALRIGRIFGPSVLIHQTSLGEALALTSGAPARAILAHLSEAEFARAVDNAGQSQHAAALRRSSDTVVRDGVSIETSLVDATAFDVAAALLDRDGTVVAAVVVEGAPGERASEISRADGPARRVMSDLAAKIRGEHAAALSHYDHIDPDRITF